MLDLWQQRLTVDELHLIQEMPHKLDDYHRDLRGKIMKREVAIDMFWGYFDDGIIASAKRRFYEKFIHPFLRKQKL